MDGDRRYSITGVLGKGGFGTVYRARYEDDLGFVKDVALKLLSDPDPPEEVLGRFRDEARILGLIRDRAVVQVAAPVRLGDRWAVVMEYVEGVSVRRMLRLAPAPPRVALGITAEIARCLHRLWNQRGPNGKPLHLRHRDLKPSNIQITPDGTVKLLDFGIARADFERRESNTTSVMHGTEGYVAPERYLGQESIKTDIFSLGVVLHVMLTRQRPKGGKKTPLDEETAMGAALALARRMYTLDPDDRPTPREVESECERQNARFGGPRLREWCEKAVPAAGTMLEDDLVGEVLTETVAVTGGMRHGALLAGGGAFVGLSGLLIGGTVALGTVLALIAWMWSNQDAPTPTDVVAPEPAGFDAPLDPDLDPDPDAPLDPDEVEPESPEPEFPDPTEPDVEPVVAPQPPVPVPSGRPDPVPVVRPEAPPPRPTPGPEAPRLPVTFVSIPPDAQVFVDGKAAGTTPLVDVLLTEGPHELRLELGEASVSRTIPVQPRAPSRYVWRVERDVLETR